MNTKVLLTLFALFAVALVACTAGPNTAGSTSLDGAGFWLGLWHGWIAVIAFIISLFDNTVRVYEVHNNGILYDLGFLLGVGAFTSGTRETAKRVRS